MFGVACFFRTIYEARETHLNLFHIGDCPDWCRHVEPRFVFELSISSRYVSRHPVSDWGMYLTNQNTASGSKPQCSVCISPSRILHQAWYVSHKPYQPHPQRLSHPARTNTIREVCLEQVCSDGVRRRKVCMY